MQTLILCFLLSVISTGNIVPGNDREKSPDKRRVLRLEPGPGNTRNSEGDFITLKDGKILFIYSHYTSGTGGDNDNSYLAGRFSTNKGRTWDSESHKIIEQEGKMNVMSVSLLRLQNGEIALISGVNRKDSFNVCSSDGLE